MEEVATGNGGVRGGASTSVLYISTYVSPLHVRL